MGQFLDSAGFASGAGAGAVAGAGGGGGGGTQTPNDGKKSTIITPGTGTSPAAIPAVSSLVSAFASGGTRVCLCFHPLFDLLCNIDSKQMYLCHFLSFFFCPI